MPNGEKEKSPPITLNELEEQKRQSDEEAKQGPLSFAGQVKSNGNGGDESGEKKGRFSMGGGKGAQMVIPAFVAVVLAAGMLFMFAPSKADMNIMKDTVENLSTQVSEMTTAVTAAHQRIDTFINEGGSAPDLSAYATKDELNGYVKSGTLDNLESRLEVLEAYIGGGGNVTPGPSPTPQPTPTPGSTPTPSPTPSGEPSIVAELVSNQGSVYDPGVYVYELTIDNPTDYAITPTIAFELRNSSGAGVETATFVRTGGYATTFATSLSPSSTNCLLIYCSSGEVTVPANSEVGVIAELSLIYSLGGDKAVWTPVVSLN